MGERKGKGILGYDGFLGYKDNGVFDGRVFCLFEGNNILMGV